MTRSDGPFIPPTLSDTDDAALHADDLIEQDEVVHPDDIDPEAVVDELDPAPDVVDVDVDEPDNFPRATPDDDELD